MHRLSPRQSPSQQLLGDGKRNKNLALYSATRSRVEALPIWESVVPEFDKNLAVVVLKFKLRIQQHDKTVLRRQALDSEYVPCKVARMLESSVQVGTDGLVNSWLVRFVPRILFNFEGVYGAPDQNCFVSKVLYVTEGRKPLNRLWLLRRIVCVAFLRSKIASQLVRKDQEVDADTQFGWGSTYLAILTLRVVQVERY